MTTEVIVKFAPIETPDRWNSSEWTADRLKVNQLELLPLRSSVALLVNHDDNREIGPRPQALARQMDGRCGVG